jgi:tetratricopeptide (TPR) repeat protein
MTASSARFIAVATAILLSVTARAAPEPTSEELFAQGAIAYRAGRFAEAAALLERARRLEPSPILDYNLARAYEGDGRNEEAIRCYERYLSSAGEIPDRGRIERRIASLRAQSAEEVRLVTAAAAAEGAARSERRRASRQRLIAASTLAAIGGAALLSGVGVGSAAYARNNQADAAANQRDMLSFRAEAERLQLSANVLLPVGGVLAVAGSIWAIVEARRRH